MCACRKYFTGEWTLLDSFLTDEIWRWHITISYNRLDNGHYWTVFSLYFITDEIWRWYFHYILSQTRFGSAKYRQKFQTILVRYIAIKLTDLTARPICCGDNCQIVVNLWRKLWKHSRRCGCISIYSPNFNLHLLLLLFKSRFVLLFVLLSHQSKAVGKEFPPRPTKKNLLPFSLFWHHGYFVWL